MAPATPPFTPEQALATLRDLEPAETRLTARTVGVTLMLWGMFAAMLVLAVYAFDAREGTRLDQVAVPLLMALVVAGGVATTNSVWKSRALGTNAGFRPVRIWLHGLAVAVAALALAIVLANYVLATNFAVVFTLAGAFVLLYVGIRQQRQPWCRVSWALVAAVFLAVNGGLMLALLEVDSQPSAVASLWATLALGGCTFLAGALHARFG